MAAERCKRRCAQVSPPRIYSPPGGVMMDTHEQGVSVCPVQKGELCARKSMCKSVNQIMHPPAKDNLPCPISFEKKSTLLIKTL